MANKLVLSCYSKKVCISFVYTMLSHNNIFLTNGSDENLVVKGRPDLKELLRDAGRDPSDVAVFVCGPKELVQSTRKVCNDYNIDMHEEIFEF